MTEKKIEVRLIRGEKNNFLLSMVISCFLFNMTKQRQ